MEAASRQRSTLPAAVADLNVQYQQHQQLDSWLVLLHGQNQVSDGVQLERSPVAQQRSADPPLPCEHLQLLSWLQHMVIGFVQHVLMKLPLQQWFTDESMSATQTITSSHFNCFAIEVTASLQLCSTVRSIQCRLLYAHLLRCTLTNTNMLHCSTHSSQRWLLQFFAGLLSHTASGRSWART